MSKLQAAVKKFIADQNAKSEKVKIVPIHEIVKKSPLLKEIFDARIESAYLLDVYGNIGSDAFRGKLNMLIIEAFRRGVEVGRRKRRLVAPGLVNQALKIKAGSVERKDWIRAFLTDSEIAAAKKTSKPRFKKGPF